MNCIVTTAAFDVVAVCIAEYGVIPLACVYFIGTCTSGNCVIAFIAVDLIIAITSANGIVSGASFNNVGIRGTIECVVSALAIQIVESITAIEFVVSAATVHAVIAGVSVSYCPAASCKIKRVVSVTAVCVNRSGHCWGDINKISSSAGIGHANVFNATVCLLSTQ